MVRNAYGMVLMEWVYEGKSQICPKEKSVKKLNMCLNWVEKKNGEAASSGNYQKSKDKSIGDKLRSQHMV